MGCKSKTSIKCNRYNQLGNDKSVLFDDFILDGLTKTGRLQFFFHSPSSEFPIRDILDEQNQGHKTEPHIEIGAENYINCCYQLNNIIPFLKSKEQYLFLFTTCKSQILKEYCGERFIVGYIMKQGVIDCNEHYAVQGTTRLHSFKDAYPLRRLFPKHKNVKNIRIKRLSTEETEKILNHFKGKRSILRRCIKEIKSLEKKNREKDKTCLVLRGNICEYQTECLRWK